MILWNIEPDKKFKLSKGKERRTAMDPEKSEIKTESVYKIITLIGTSTESWEKAAAAAVEQASKTLRDLRIAEIEKLDMHLEDGKILAYRARVQISFRYHG
jgi:flavin-binding protein dodecin